MHSLLYDPIAETSFKVHYIMILLICTVASSFRVNVQSMIKIGCPLERESCPGWKEEQHPKGGQGANHACRCFQWLMTCCLAASADTYYWTAIFSYAALRLFICWLARGFFFYAGGPSVCHIPLFLMLQGVFLYAMGCFSLCYRGLVLMLLGS